MVDFNDIDLNNAAKIKLNYPVIVFLETSAAVCARELGAYATALSLYEDAFHFATKQEVLPYISLASMSLLLYQWGVLLADLGKPSMALDKMERAMMMFRADQEISSKMPDVLSSLERRIPEQQELKVLEDMGVNISTPVTKRRRPCPSWGEPMPELLNRQGVIEYKCFNFKCLRAR